MMACYLARSELENKNQEMRRSYADLSGQFMGPLYLRSCCFNHKSKALSALPVDWRAHYSRISIVQLKLTLHSSRDSITGNGPSLAGQIFTTFNPTLARSAVHCFSLRCMELKVVRLMSASDSKALHPTAGRIVSQMSSLEFPLSIAWIWLRRISRHFESGKSCSTRRMK